MSEPWRTEPKSTARLVGDAFEVWDASDRLVARAFLTDDGTNGAWERACLIAAAPDLLAACRALIHANDLQTAIDLARAAISKATGAKP